jgi:hypothetical protein
MNARAMLRDALADVLPDWQIVADARVLDSVRDPGAVVLWTEKLARPPKLGLDYVETTMALWVLTPSENPTRIEDDLDLLLLYVLAALELLEWCAWTEAERGVLADKFNGWRLTVSCLNKITEE